MVEQMLQADEHIRCLYFSIEMSRDDLIARSLSRLASLSGDFRQPLSWTGRGAGVSDEASRCLTANDVLKGRWKNNDIAKGSFNQARQNYAAYGDRLFIWETEGRPTADKVKAEVEEFKKAYIDGRLIVVIDYLQIMGGAEHLTDKQNTDNNVLGLAQLSRDFKIPVVAISSLNRAATNGKVNISSFKESGGIEYSAHGVWALDFQGAGKEGFDSTKAKEDSPRKMELMILKGRNGRVFSSEGIKFDYYPAYNLFVEEDGGVLSAALDGRVREDELESRSRELDEAEAKLRSRKARR